jgi:hypothetical protein
LCAIGRKNWMFLGSDRGGETAAICYRILANAKRHHIEPFAYVRALLVALSSDKVDLESLLPDVWIAAHPEHVLTYSRDEGETAAARRRQRALRRAQAKQPSLVSGGSCTFLEQSQSGAALDEAPGNRRLPLHKGLQDTKLYQIWTDRRKYA